MTPQEAGGTLIVLLILCLPFFLILITGAFCAFILSGQIDREQEE